MGDDKMLSKSILVVGGGMSGLTAAIEAAEVGREVYIVEKNAYLGGKVAQMNKYFPKLCPPSCGLEINFRRIKQNPRINFFTQAEIENISGQEGNFDVTVRLNPRYVNENCTACGMCTEVCPVERPNAFNYGMDKTKAIYLPHEFAYPMKYVIDGEYCKGDECTKCMEACKYEAIDLKMQAKSINLKVGAIIWATGWNPYDEEKVNYYGFGKCKNVINNVMMERLASVNGPTGGRIKRPSDGEEVKKIAFVQCAGSRDENHLPYCSRVCCLASLKQATYLLEQNPDAEVYIFYIDIRALGRYEDFFVKVQNEKNVHLIKGKAGEITEDPESNDVTIRAEDQETGKIITEKFDMAVLAAGMVPSTAEEKLPNGSFYDDDGFLIDTSIPGIYAAGCVKKPLDVASSIQDATAAALRAIQSTVRRQENG